MKTRLQYESVGYLLTQICKMRRNKMNEMLAAHDMHAGQDMLVYHLHQQDGQTISELVEKICIQPATVSGMVSRMEATGIVVRRKEDEDRRISRVYLTATGKASYKAVSDIWKKLELQTTQGLTDTEKEAAAKLLKNMLSNFD